NRRPVVHRIPRRRGVGLLVVDTLSDVRRNGESERVVRDGEDVVEVDADASRCSTVRDAALLHELLDPSGGEAGGGGGVSGVEEGAVHASPSRVRRMASSWSGPP